MRKMKKFLHSSHSSCEVSILFVKKSDESLWLYIDYRGFNKLIIKNRYSLSLIEKLLDKLSNTQFFIKFNIHDEFNHLRMTSEEEWKMIFRYRYRLFEYIIMLFDLYNDSEMFQHYMNDIFRDFLDESISTIFSSTPKCWRNISNIFEEFLNIFMIRVYISNSINIYFISKK